MRLARYPRAIVAFGLGIVLLVGIGVFRAVPIPVLEGKSVTATSNGCVVAMAPRVEGPISDGTPVLSIGHRLTDATAVHPHGDLIGNYVSSSWFLGHPLPSEGLGTNTLSGFYGLERLVTRHGIASGPDLRCYAPIVRVGVYNTTDYLAVFASDFGFVGALLLSALLGAGAMWIFLQAYARRRLEDVQALALVTVALVSSLRGNYFGAVGFGVTPRADLSTGAPSRDACFFLPHVPKSARMTGTTQESLKRE